VNRVDERFSSMGGEARVRLESGVLAMSELRGLFGRVRAKIDEVERKLTRFDEASELSRFNAEPTERVLATPLVMELVRAARWAYETSGGLVDAALLDELERAGYASSLAGAEPASLAEALAAAPKRRPARPAHHEAGALAFSIEGRDHVLRPPGLRLDSGGLAKGIAADLAARMIPDGVRFAISCGGDLAVGPSDWRIAVTSAFGPREVHRLGVTRGGVATSGIQRRLWRDADGVYGHHLLDPSTGLPAWTGLVAATAVGRSALEAEVLAKTALLSGPDAAWRLLSRFGGVLQHEDERVEVVPRAQVVRLARRSERLALAPRPPGAAA
jgi:thiamine biosynthesis lipoprotein